MFNSPGRTQHNTRKLLKKENKNSNIQFKQSKMGNIGAKNMLQTLDIPKIVIVGNVLSTLRTVAEWWNPSSITSHFIMWTILTRGISWNADSLNSGAPHSMGTPSLEGCWISISWETYRMFSPLWWLILKWTVLLDLRQ